MASPQVLSALPVTSPGRSYGRKRKNTSDGDDVMMGQRSMSPETPGRIATPSKRIKAFGHEPTPLTQSEMTATSSQTLPVARLLETLNKEDLLNMVLALINQHPVLETSVAALLPKPTLASATTHLQQLLKNLEAAFPYNRWGPDRSDYAFNRVRSQLVDLLETFQHYLTHFTEPSMYAEAVSHEYPSNAFSFLRFCTRMASTLPVWSSDHHNSSCRDLAYSKISKAWSVAIGEMHRRIREEGRMYPTSVIAEWARDLTAESQNLKGAFGFAEVMQDFNLKLGWVIGLNGPGSMFADNNSLFSHHRGHFAPSAIAPVSTGGSFSYRS
ncbi:Tethering factor for nuclear proteasome sts1 [Phlyctochytrium planicorne]|nr:Tethering factor for nuclear proteasome sts1 [Phlyctochytrium planicorne]